MAALTDADKVLRNDTGLAIVEKLEDIADALEGGGGASVTLGTTPPSDSSGSNGGIYVQYDGTSYTQVEDYVKINNSWRKSPYSRVVALTQAEYDLITPDAQTLYIITDAQSSYQTKQDANLQTTADTIVGAINELNDNQGNKGSSGIWEWIKYPDGTFELWGFDNPTETLTINQWGTGLYGCDIAGLGNYPFTISTIKYASGDIEVVGWNGINSIKSFSNTSGSQGWLWERGTSAPSGDYTVNKSLYIRGTYPL